MHIRWPDRVLERLIAGVRGIIADHRPVRLTREAILLSFLTLVLRVLSNFTPLPHVLLCILLRKYARDARECRDHSDNDRDRREIRPMSVRPVVLSPSSHDASLRLGVTPRASPNDSGPATSHSAGASSPNGCT